MKKIFFLILVFALLFSFSPVMAEANDGTDMSVPSSLSLWWQGVKESVSLGLTFDPVKKAEKALNYAENRMKIAEQFAAQTNNPEAQEKAEAMIERAQGFMERVQAGQEKWMNSNKEDRKLMLMQNVVRYQENRGVVMDRIEAGLTDAQKDKFNELRTKGVAISERLLTALENENIPEEVKTQLEEIKARIETHAEEVKAYIQQRAELRERIQAGDETALEELRALNEQRREEVQVQMQNRMENREQIRQNAQDAGAAIREQVQNRVQDMDTAEMEQRREEAVERMENNSNTGAMMDGVNGGVKAGAGR